MQLIVDIDNDILAQKIIQILNIFKGDGLHIKKGDEKVERVEYSDKYIEENWRELAMTHIDNSDYYKSEEYKMDRAIDYEKREKI